MEIHPAFSKTQVLVVPTDEEVSIAMQASSMIQDTTTEEEGSVSQFLKARYTLFMKNLDTIKENRALGHYY